MAYRGAASELHRRQVILPQTVVTEAMAKTVMAEAVEGVAMAETLAVTATAAAAAAVGAAEPEGIEATEEPGREAHLLCGCITATVLQSTTVTYRRQQVEPEVVRGQAEREVRADQVVRVARMAGQMSRTTADAAAGVVTGETLDAAATVAAAAADLQ
jgi:hypothetical protein